jgi:hypothetical protein
MAQLTPDTNLPKPNYEDGIDYWNNQTADLDGVLGQSFGSGRAFVTSNVLTSRRIWLWSENFL